MQSFLSLKKILSLFLGALLLGVIFNSKSCIAMLEPNDNNKFLEKLNVAVRQKENFFLENVNANQWSKACVLLSMSTGGIQNKEKYRQYFDIGTDIDISLPNGVVSTSESNWAILFFAPPNSITAYSVPNSIVRNGGIYPIDKRPCGTRGNIFVEIENSVLDENITLLKFNILAK